MNLSLSLNLNLKCLCRPLKGLPRWPLAVEMSDGDEFTEWDNWARNQLMSAGSDLLGKFSNLQVLIKAFLVTSMCFS